MLYCKKVDYFQCKGTGIFCINTGVNITLVIYFYKTDGPVMVMPPRGQLNSTYEDQTTEGKK